MHSYPVTSIFPLPSLPSSIPTLLLSFLWPIFFPFPRTVVVEYSPIKNWIQSFTAFLTHRSTYHAPHYAAVNGEALFTSPLLCFEPRHHRTKCQTNTDVLTTPRIYSPPPNIKWTEHIHIPQNSKKENTRGPLHSQQISWLLVSRLNSGTWEKPSL